jgi:hypothetical protein
MRKAIVVLALAAAPLAARGVVSLGVEATLAAPRLGMERLPGSERPLVAAGDVGGSVLLRLGPLALGAAMDRTPGEDAGRLSTKSAMGGFALDLLPFVRMELLGEIGVADLSRDAARETRFYGARPGLSLKLPAFPLRLGVWGLARWGLPGFPANEPSFGILARAGLEFGG